MGVWQGWGWEGKGAQGPAQRVFFLVALSHLDALGV